MLEFKTHLQNLKNTIDVLQEKNLDLTLKKSNLQNFEASRHDHYKRRYTINIELLKQSLNKLNGIDTSLLLRLTNEINFLDNVSLNEAKKKVDKIAELLSQVELPEKSETIHIPLKLPNEIKEELLADIKEIHKCFDNQAYRAVVILCGRLLETTLHWKYYNETGYDLLEKSPGIGLGNLIAKLRDKNITFDPGISQQIHLVNQVRVFSVHTKKDTFNPSQKQAEAIMLYTMDILEKLVK